MFHECVRFDVLIRGKITDVHRKLKKYELFIAKEKLRKKILKTRLQASYF